MKITDIKIRLVDPKPGVSIEHPVDDRLRAIASVTFCGVLTVDDILVLKGFYRLFIRYPQNQSHQSVVVPRIPEFSKQIESAILENYRRKAGLLDKQEA